MSADGPSDELLRAVADDPVAASADRLDALRAECARLRDDEEEIADLTQRLATANGRRETRRMVTIPDLMDAARTNIIGLEAEGNHPAAVVTVAPYYRANIAADWDPDRREAGFDAVTAHDGGDLIKTTLTLRFPKEERGRAVLIADELRDRGFDVEVAAAIAWSTLTAWLKERHQRSLPIPPLDVIGGTIGRQATIKPAKAKR